MSEKTLKEVGEEATSLYSAHKHTADRMQNPAYSKKRYATQLEQHDRLNTLEADQFASNNAEQLHDLAVVEAHLGGVAINVEQPIVVGQKVDVHVQK